LPSSSYGTSSSTVYVSDANTGQYAWNRYGLYGTSGLVSDFVDGAVIRTNSLEETNQYLERSASHIYRDSSPEIIHLSTTEAPITHEQRIHVRFLLPPDVPPPGPLIIKEVRPPQPPPLQPLVIHQFTPSVPAPPPIVLRERPPTPPPHIPSETIIKHLPALPVPPRSVVIHRFPAHPERPRDILIERWLPYGPQPERRKIIEHAPPPIAYPEPRNKIIIHGTAEARVVRRFKTLDVVRGNPADYIARYGGTLLDSATLLQQARNAGVFEDITPPPLSSITYTNIRGSSYDYDLYDDIVNRDYSLRDTIVEKRITYN
jgi:hypothetical protein